MFYLWSKQIERRWFINENKSKCLPFLSWNWILMYMIVGLRDFTMKNKCIFLFLTFQNIKFIFVYWNWETFHLLLCIFCKIIMDIICSIILRTKKHNNNPTMC